MSNFSVLKNNSTSVSKSPILARRRLRSDHLVINTPGNFNLLDAKSKKNMERCSQSDRFLGEGQRNNSPNFAVGEKSWHRSEKKHHQTIVGLEPVAEANLDLSETIESEELKADLTIIKEKETLDKSAEDCDSWEKIIKENQTSKKLFHEMRSFGVQCQIMPTYSHIKRNSYQIKDSIK